MAKHLLLLFRCLHRLDFLDLLLHEVAQRPMLSLKLSDRLLVAAKASPVVVLLRVVQNGLGKVGTDACAAEDFWANCASEDGSALTAPSAVNFASVLHLKLARILSKKQIWLNVNKQKTSSLRKKCNICGTALCPALYVFELTFLCSALFRCGCGSWCSAVSPLQHRPEARTAT